MNKEIWLFGYGSLTWKTTSSLSYSEKHWGYITDFTRRFYQLSPDHRGTLEKPGLVVTLVPEKSAKTYGMCYKLTYNDIESSLKYLNYREKCGYEIHYLDVHINSRIVNALVYIASKENEYFNDSLSYDQIAIRITESHGPSGSNIEYLLKLVEALRNNNSYDKHLFDIEEIVNEMIKVKVKIKT